MRGGGDRQVARNHWIEHDVSSFRVPEAAGLARLGEGRVTPRLLPGAVFLEQVPQGAA
jgi:hypothetical protein